MPDEQGMDAGQADGPEEREERDEALDQITPGRPDRRRKPSDAQALVGDTAASEPVSYRRVLQPSEERSRHHLGMIPELSSSPRPAPPDVINPSTKRTTSDAPRGE